MTNLAETIEICDTGGAETIARQQACSAEGEPVQINHEIAVTTSLDQIEAMMLAAPQIDCPLVHHFGGWHLYRAKAFMPAGTYMLGHARTKTRTMNVHAQGQNGRVIVNGERQGD